LLTISLTRNIRQRLLHPGASTVDILQFYISMIRAFSLLDPTGVLLDKVARPVRRYLKEREDTIHIVVAGLLADPDDAPGNDNPNSTNDVLIELATELSRSAEYIGQGGDDDGDMDWDDMNWEPDPIDAGPGMSRVLHSISCH
jgi:anaphase-promoting complex subunit 2